MKLRTIVTAVVLLACLALAGCGSGELSEGELKNILPENITSCYFNEDLRTQEVTDINIVRADVEEDTQYVQCEITMKDDDMQRCVYAELNLKKYETGGWQVDSWMPYEKDRIMTVREPNEATVSEYMDQLGFKSLTAGDSSLDCGEFATYEKSYTVDEDYTYARFAGTVVYRAELTEYNCTPDDGPGRYSWEGKFARSPEIDYSGLTCTWNIAKHWSGAQIDPGDKLPTTFDVTLDKLEEGSGLSGTGILKWPAHDGMRYTGEYGSYDFVAATYKTEGECPANAKASLALSFVYGPAVMLSFTPDTLEASQKELIETIYFDVDGADSTPATDSEPASSGASAASNGADDASSGAATSPSTPSSDDAASSASAPSAASAPSTGEPSDGATSGEASSAAAPAATPANALVVHPSETGADGYILPQFSTHEYTEKELSGLSTWELCLARNEIPARHGFIFDNGKVASYFESKNWYEGKLTRKEFRSIEGILNTTEEANVETILKMEEKRNSPYMPKS